MTAPTRRKARPLLIAALSATTLVFSGCDDNITNSGNLLAPNCDMDPSYCAQPDSAVPDLDGGPDLGDVDAGTHD